MAATTLATSLVSKLRNISIDPHNSTGSVNITSYPETTIGDVQYNVQARIGYYYPIRVIESVVGFIGNSMVILAVGRYKDLQTATGSLLANLALADLLGASLTIFSIVGETMDRTTRWLSFCISKEILYIIAAYGNITTLTMISIDRLIAVSKPWWYQANMKMQKVLPFQGIVWVGIVLTYSLVLTLRSTATLSIPICVFPFLLSLRDTLLFMVYPFGLCTGITVFNYALLGWMMCRQVRTVNAPQMVQRQRKLSKTTALVIFIYIALTAPVGLASYMVSFITKLSQTVSHILHTIYIFNLSLKTLNYKLGNID